LKKHVVRSVSGAALAAVLMLGSGAAQGGSCSDVEIGGKCFHFTSITLPGFQGELVGVNKKGDIVGSNSPVNTFIHPTEGFEIHSDGTVEVIQDPLAPNFTELTNINDKGEMAGWIYDGNFIHGFTRSAAGDFTAYDLFTPTVRNTGTQVRAFNNFGDLGGRTIGMLPSDVAFLKVGNNVSTFTYLGSQTFVSAINNHGDAAGFALVGGLSRGYVRAADGTMTAIDFPGAKSTGVLAINDHGDVAGDWTDFSNVIHGFVYLPSTQQYYSFDFPTAGVTETFATVITNQGEIYGNYVANLTPEGFLLTSKH